MSSPHTMLGTALSGGMAMRKSASFAAPGGGAVWAAPTLAPTHPGNPGPGRHAAPSHSAWRWRKSPSRSGLGASIVFDVGTSPGRAGPDAVVHALIAGGGGLIDGACMARRKRWWAILRRPPVSGKGLYGRQNTKIPARRGGGGARVPATAEDTSSICCSLAIWRFGSGHGRRPLKAQGLCRYTGITTTFGG